MLIGTQMLAKGMDLLRVTLAAVLAADGLLHRPDLRASEQALQLLMQLAGRAGRGERPGQVLVQTYSPDHPVIRHLVDGRYEAFLAEEIQLRREAGLVPFSRACLLRLSGESASATATAASVLAERIRPICQERSWWLLGPAPAPVARVAGRSRWQLLLHGPVDSAPRCLPGPPSGMNSLVVLRCRLTLIRWSSDLRRAVRESRTPDVDECLQHQGQCQEHCNSEAADPQRTPAPVAPGQFCCFPELDRLAGGALVQPQPQFKAGDWGDITQIEAKMHPLIDPHQPVAFLQLDCGGRETDPRALAGNLHHVTEQGLHLG